MLDHVCAVVISYYPDATILKNVEVLRQQVDCVVIVDNGSSETSQQWLTQLESMEGIHLIWNDQNLGIAYALNQGIQFAWNHHYMWAATFDQDSCPSESMISTMLKIFETEAHSENVGILAPTYLDIHTGNRNQSRHCRNGQTLVEIPAVMTSGNLVRTSIFNKLGGFAEDYFIDYVDYEYCLRLRKNGYRVLQVCDAVLHHQRGKMEQHSFLGKTVVTTNHNPLRRYYIARNRIIFYKTYGFFDPVLCLRDLIELGRDFFKIILFETERGSKLRYFFKGVWDGITNQMGPYSH